MVDLDSVPTAFPEERAQSLLAPYLAVLAACIRESWGRWLNFLNADGVMASPLSARTRAGIVSDHMWHLVKTRFAGMPGACTSEERGLRILSLNDQVNI